MNEWRQRQISLIQVNVLRKTSKRHGSPCLDHLSWDGDGPRVVHEILLTYSWRYSQQNVESVSGRSNVDVTYVQPKELLGRGVSIQDMTPFLHIPPLLLRSHVSRFSSLMTLSPNTTPEG